MTWDDNHRAAARRAFWIVLLFTLPAIAAAAPQDAYKPANSTSKRKPATDAAKYDNLKLTPGQKRGLQMLKVAKAEAGNLEPAMRAAVLWQVAHGYFKIDMARYRSGMADAFRAATEAPDNNADLKCFIIPDECHAKPWLERQILIELVNTFPHDAEELLPQAESEVRNRIIGNLILRYVQDKKLDHAEELLQSVSDQKGLPYEAAAQLMLALPPERSQEQVRIFTTALGNYRTFHEGEFGLMGAEDLGTLVIRFWNHLPVPTVLEAIDELLGQAQEFTEKEKENGISVSTRKGSLFLSFYDYRLFELLPVIRELDSSRAERLMREHEQAAGALQKYPNGLTSLDASYRDTPLTKSEAEIQDFPEMRMGDSPAERALDEAQNAAAARVVSEEQVAAIRQAHRDPKQALQTAMSLPLWSGSHPGLYSPRAGTLVHVAAIVAKKDPATADKAVDEALKIVDQIQPSQGGSLISRICETYVKMKDMERAAKALSEGMKVAKKLHESDTNASDPNLALKAAWPSAGLWGKLVMLGTQISPQLGEKLLREIDDPEIRAFATVWLANGLLGNEWQDHSIIWRKNGQMEMAVF